MALTEISGLMARSDISLIQPYTRMRRSGINDIQNNSIFFLMMAGLCHDEIPISSRPIS